MSQNQPNERAWIFFLSVFPKSFRFTGFTLLNYHFLFIEANLHKTFDHISRLDEEESSFPVL